MTAPQSEPLLSPPALRQAWPYLALVFFSLLSLYVWSAPRTVVLEDDGSFSMAAYFLGIAHPPGYPLFVLLAKPFTLLPLGEVAFRVHVASATFGAAACAVLWWIARCLVPSSLIATLATLAFGLSRVMWSQSIIADVYSLNLLVFLCLFAGCISYLDRPRNSLIAGLAFGYGLGLSNHWPLLILATPCLVLLLWPERQSVNAARKWTLPALALGLSPYLWMLLRSQAEPQMSFYGPIRSLEEFLFFVSRLGYKPAPMNFGADIWDKLAFAGFYAREYATQLTLVGTGVAGVGAWSMWRGYRIGWNLALLAALLSGGFAVVALRNLEYEFLEQLQYRVYPLIPYSMLALYLAQGLWVLRSSLATRWPRFADHAVHLAAVSLVGFLFVQNLPTNARGDDRFAADYATTILESMKPNASLFVFHDFDAFPLGYLSLVEELRPDVTLYHESGLTFPSRLSHALASAAEKQRALRAFLDGASGPVYFINNPPSGYAQEHFGFYVKLYPSRSAGPTRYTVREDLLMLARRMRENSALQDSWSVALRNTSLTAFAQLLMNARLSDSSASQALDYERELEASRSNYYGLVGQLYAAVDSGQVAPQQILEWAERAEALQDETVSLGHRAELFTAKGGALSLLGRRDEAAESFRASVELIPLAENPAVLKLLRELAQTGEREEYRALRDRFFANRVGPPELMSLERELDRDSRGR